MLRDPSHVVWYVFVSHKTDNTDRDVFSCYESPVSRKTDNTGWEVCPCYESWFIFSGISFVSHKTDNIDWHVFSCYESPVSRKTDNIDWEVFPYYESWFMFSGISFVSHKCDLHWLGRVPMLWELIYILWYVPVRHKACSHVMRTDLCSLVCFCVSIYVFVCDLTIYVLCLLSIIVPFAHTTFPRYPTEWGPTAQKTGKHLRCGPSELSASLYPPLVICGAPWGLRVVFWRKVWSYEVNDNKINMRWIGWNFAAGYQHNMCSRTGQNQGNRRSTWSVAFEEET